MGSISARIRVRTQMELPGEEQNREQADKKEPGVFSTHVINKTKLRQERLSGQAIPGRPMQGLRPFSVCRPDSPIPPIR